MQHGRCSNCLIYSINVFPVIALMHIDFNQPAQFYFFAGIYCLHEKLAGFEILIPPKMLKWVSNWSETHFMRIHANALKQPAMNQSEIWNREI